MSNRRQFLAGLLATGIAPAASWADAGSPHFLAAAARSDGDYVLCGISAARQVLFEIPLPGRGHAAAAHPKRPEAVAFARRPGTFAVVIDCATGGVIARLSSPLGRHFYGHGVFSQNGDWLFTTENDFEVGTGRVAVWDAANNYARVADFPSGGIGPHEIRRLPGSDTLVIANGGIDTHPDSGRTKLNIPTMAPNLTYCEDGAPVETAALAPEWHKNSIRHIDVAPDGTVAIGMQWQGDGPSPAMVAVHRRGQAMLSILDAPDTALRDLNGYIGSIACDPISDQVVATSPRGGVVHVYDVTTRRFVAAHSFADVSGVAPGAGHVMVTTGNGELINLSDASAPITRLPYLRWDNHLVSLMPG